jgi:hypothetical protein
MELKIGDKPRKILKILNTTHGQKKLCHSSINGENLDGTLFLPIAKILPSLLWPL